MSFLKILCVACLSLFLTIGCSTSRSGKIYTQGEALMPHDVETATILAVENVTIRKDGSILGSDGEYLGTAVGTITGSVLGGIAGSTVGNGAGRDAAMVLGVVLGGAIGSWVEKHTTDKDALKLTINPEDGKPYAIIQEADIQFTVGERVYITTNPSSGVKRVTKF